jgi:DNA polymerase II
MKEVIGWLFDLYEHPQKGVVLWIIDEKGKPHCFHQDFEITFYAGGSFPRLRELWMFLRSRKVKLAKVTRDDLFDGPQEVMEIRVQSPTIFRKLFREAKDNFPDLNYYDVDVPLTIRYVAKHNVFMLALCKADVDASGNIINIRALDSPEDLDHKLPHFRILSLATDKDPSHEPPKYLNAKFGKSYIRLPFDRPRQLLTILNCILLSYDPDVVQTHYGDAWLFPYLEKIAIELHIPFNPNRDSSMPVLKRKEISFSSYGQPHYRAPQFHLRGRWHVDVENGMTYSQYQLGGAIEQMRWSSLSLQEVTRRSPGAAIAAMQDLAAIRRGVLVPHENQKGEITKTYNELIRADRGGLVFQPKPGIYPDVAILDFSSMMASLMIEFNISPETVASIQTEGEGLEVPELGIKILSHLGLIPQMLKPLRDKRLALKRRLRTLKKGEPLYQRIHRRLKPIVDGIKWLTVVCYGRLGFANSRFGRINSHEAVSYFSRKIITHAKLIAEELGFDVLHLYVDSLFVSKRGATREDFQALAEAIERATHLPMDFDGIVYPWFAFLSARANTNIGVANRFYGLAPDGEHKIRGIALRRRDTPRFVANTQMSILSILAKESDQEKLTGCLPEILAVLQEQLRSLKAGKVSLEALVVTQRLSRDPKEFSVLSPSAIVARQLKQYGKTVKRGQRIRFIYIAPAPGVWAWDASTLPNLKSVDRMKYRELLIRAVHEILQPLGVTEAILRNWLIGKAGYLAPPGLLKSTDPTRLALPLLADMEYLRLGN